jgi:hypothetical protein
MQRAEHTHQERDEIGGTESRVQMIHA